MRNTKLNIYSSPEIEILEVRIEQGIAASNGDAIAPPVLEEDDTWN